MDALSTKISVTQSDPDRLDLKFSLVSVGTLRSIFLAEPDLEDLYSRCGPELSGSLHDRSNLS